MEPNTKNIKDIEHSLTNTHTHTYFLAKISIILHVINRGRRVVNQILYELFNFVHLKDDILVLFASPSDART